jgi:hypothetical protein
MSISVQTLGQLSELLTSDRMTYKGNEVMRVCQMLAEIQTEQRNLLMQQRVVPKAETMGMMQAQSVLKEAGPPPLAPMKRHEDEED